MKEQDIQAKISKHLKKLGAYVVNVSSAYPNGCPDLLICFKGKFIAIEVKIPGKKARPLQQYQLDKIAESGGFSCVATCLEDLTFLESKTI
jgi:Holliday junction resolvase